MNSQMFCNRRHFGEGGHLLAVFEFANVSLVDANSILWEAFATTNSLNGNPEGFSEIHLLTRKRHDKALLLIKGLYAIAIFSFFLRINFYKRLWKSQRPHNVASSCGSLFSYGDSESVG